jgi:hypothetical protein
MMNGLYVFDVDRARRLAGDREPEEVDEVRLRRVLARRGICREHVPHADHTRPGLVGVIAEGRAVLRVLLDGAHRAARAVREGVPFRAQVLTVAETRRCLMA